MGGDELLEASRSVQTGRICAGGVILPGLIDAHLHLKAYALSLQKIDCETTTLEECLERVRQRAARHATGPMDPWARLEPKHVGRVAHCRGPGCCRAGHPVYLTAKSLHASWANPERCSSLRASAPGRQIPGMAKSNAMPAERQLASCWRAAAELVSRMIPEPDMAALADAIEKAQRMLWSFGLTGVHDFDRRDCFMALQQLHAEGRLKLRVIKNIPVELLDAGPRPRSAHRLRR